MRLGIQASVWIVIDVLQLCAIVYYNEFNLVNISAKMRCHRGLY